MKMRLSLGFLILLIFGAGWVKGQSLRKFSENKVEYINQLREFLPERNEDRDEDEEILPLVNHFDTLWKSSGISPEEAALTVSVSNNLLRKRVTEFESWRHFLKLIEYYEEMLPEEELFNFLQNFEELSRRPARQSRKYLQNLYLTFYEQTLYDDGRLRWMVFGDEPEYSFADEPVLSYQNVDLWSYLQNDSSVIEGTDFRYYPRQGKLEGQKGIVYFTRAGLTTDSAYADLSSYEIALEKGSYEADSVTLHSRYYLTEPVFGALEEKLTSLSGRPEAAVYPRFRSYSREIRIPRLLPLANFKGGVAVIGSKFYGYGTETEKAELRFNYKDTLLIKTLSERFLMRPDKIYSEDVEAVIYMKKDSIYHRQLDLRYLPEQKSVTLIRKNEGMGSAPFSNSFHRVDMQLDRVIWNIGTPRLVLGNINIGGAEEPVVFESHEYFRERRFAQIEGLSRRNPLVDLKNLAEANGGKRSYTTQEIGRYLGMDESNAHIFLMRMAILGFVNYRLETREAVLKDKIFDYLNNMRRLRDYDVIQFVSRVEGGANAYLSLENYDMEVNGIKNIALSDSQKVALYPYEEKITLRRELDFDFNGRIDAGRFNFWGQEFKFSYDDFMIGMTDVDSMRFKVPSFEQNLDGSRNLVNVKTVLQDLNGELYIDKPNNKSGKTRYSEYPIFKSGKDSYIYYDKASIFDSVYNRERFYVQLEPFEIDSLDNASTAGLSFEGNFTSAGIFPDMAQTIKVQPDYSLGFTDETPPEGLSAYGGKGTFTQNISLSNKGLRGQGRLDYLNSYALSEEFFFFPDSTKGLAYQYEIEEKTGGVGSNPHVIGEEVDLKWVPYEDVLYTSTRANLFAMYDELGMEGKGRLAHSPQGVKGRGLMQFLDSETRSKDYTFESQKLLSPDLAFRVRANPRANWGFSVEEAKAEIDFSQQRGFFELADPENVFSFPANQYIAGMNEARWIIPEKAITVENAGRSQLGPLTSVKSEQDSLTFDAEYAKFYLTRSQLEVFQVPEILVADAAIFPDTGYVLIDTAANMRTLQNASISASLSNEYHQFYGCKLKISSANYYQGEGDYEYVDQDGTPWPIYMKEIKADTGVTVGFGQIAEADGFYMSPYFAYAGNVYLKANRKALRFRGRTHIETNCEAISTNWFEFESLIDPGNIVIDLPEIDPEDKTKLLANGVFLNADTISGYAAFLSREVSPADKQMFFANGVLYYDEGITSYVITDPERIKNKNAPYNLLSLNNLDCTMRGEGVMSLGDGNSLMDLNSWGIIEYDLETDEMKLDLVLGLDFHFDDDIKTRMAYNINSYGAGSGVDLTRRPFQLALNFLMEPEEREAFITAIESYGLPEKMPRVLEQTILIGQTTLNWSPESISFRSEGKVGLSGIGRNVVNAQLEGFYEIQRKRRGDEIYLLLDMDRSSTIYFEYKRNVLGIYSTDEVIMDRLKELDLKDRREEEDGYPPFTYGLSSEGKMNRFIRRFDLFDD